MELWGEHGAFDSRSQKNLCPQTLRGIGEAGTEGTGTGTGTGIPTPGTDTTGIETFGTLYDRLIAVSLAQDISGFWRSVLDNVFVHGSRDRIFDCSRSKNSALPMFLALQV
jgi:hypothetical protein